MANTQFSISTGPQVHAAIKAHADAAGLDVSGYMVAAAVAQMAADDAAAAAFATLDADNAAALDDLPAFEALTAEEQKLVRRVLSSALGSNQADVATPACSWRC
ncbi:hypothetical protein GCM10010191_77740 [Actinomadura vinacea]|uniref:DUF1778 domain-containing protein n=1 Tax=Actinomadura vinacea TaxID=115336 RepID=A0ABN3K3S1_9ACTN